MLGLLGTLLVVGGVVAGITLLTDGGDDGSGETTTVNAAALSVPQYGMSTPAGNLAVHRMIVRVVGRLRAGALKSPSDVTSAVRNGVRDVAEAGFVDVFEPDVRDAIFEALWPSLEVAGIDPTKVPTAAAKAKQQRR